MMRPLALTATEWATLLGIPTAIIVAVAGPLIQRRAQEKREDQVNQGGYVGQLIRGYEGRIKDLRDQVAADRAEFQADLARERAEREAEVADARRECEERVRELHETYKTQMHELEQRLETKVDNYRRDRDYWRARAEGKLNGRERDDTPPPDNRR